jgi:uncharacterized membrane protein
MTMGPVQLIVLGFKNPDFRGEIIQELERLRENDTTRVIDALAVYKDGMGEIEVMHMSQLSPDEAARAGSKVADLVGLEIEGESTGTGTGGGGGTPGSDGGEWDVLEEIPRNTAAALLLIEHRWAAPLRDAVVRAGGFRLADGFINPMDLVEIGLVSQQESEELLAMEEAVAGSR